MTKFKTVVVAVHGIKYPDTATPQTLGFLGHATPVGQVFNGYATPSVVNVGLPTGGLLPFAGTTAPTGYLLCNGASVSTTTYAALFAVVAYTYGGSGGSFSVPDLRGRIPMGAGTGAGLTARAIAATPGAEAAALAATDIPQHLHGAGTLIIPPHSHTFDAAASGSPFTIRAQLSGTATLAAQSTSTTISANAVSGSTALTATPTTSPANVQPSLVLNYIIKT